ncbi:hypothetical protein C2L65_32705 [Paraburkholderia terrae]|uniref:Uncharacterized protein n=2 Tax=Paraburkholderia terrae TaxID=311230 RepID=A0A2I8EYI1_9BURK|nr:hypothetical protein C2L65_32705 [Paraburkholderia terrae]
MIGDLGPMVVLFKSIQSQIGSGANETAASLSSRFNEWTARHEQVAKPISGIELMHRIRKGQFDLSKLQRAAIPLYLLFTPQPIEPDAFL